MRKQKLDKNLHVDPMVLTKKDMDVIRVKVRDKMTELWQQFEQQYHQALGNV